MQSAPKPKKRRKKQGYSIQEKRMDAKFSILIRLNADLTCLRCGKRYFLLDSMKIPRSIHACHNVSRRKRNSRWSYDNVHCCCYGCHSYLDSYPDEFDKLVIDKGIHGNQTLIEMKQQANQIFRGDRNLIEIWIDQQLEIILPDFPRLNYDLLGKIYTKLNY